MFGRHKRRGDDADVAPDLPITPMLDMSFQLLAFFIMTFKPTPTEMQIAMALPPPSEGGGGAPPSLIADQPINYTMVVSATSDGKIGSIKLDKVTLADGILTMKLDDPDIKKLLYEGADVVA